MLPLSSQSRLPIPIEPQGADLAKWMINDWIKVLADLFADSHNRAEILYRLLANALLKGLKPMSYFKELLEKIPVHPVNRLEEKLLANWESLRQDTEAA